MIRGSAFMSERGIYISKRAEKIQRRASVKYKVILADDEEEVLQSIHRQLDWESYGFEVVGTFLNGRDVMEFLETKEADIVITDIRMPFMDGIELAKNISERYPQMKVIIISGYGDFNFQAPGLNPPPLGGQALAVFKLPMKL